MQKLDQYFLSEMASSTTTSITPASLNTSTGDLTNRVTSNHQNISETKQSSVANSLYDIGAKDMKKLRRLACETNIGDPIEDDEDDEFEELITNIDTIEDEVSSIKMTLDELRQQIARLRKKIGKLPVKEEGKKAVEPKKPEDDDLNRALKLSLTEH